MDGVRVVANIWKVIGWITLVIGAIGFASALFTVLNGLFSGRVGFGVLGATLVPILVLALGPFTVWAVLRVLIEIHDRAEPAVGGMAAAGIAPVSGRGGSPGPSPVLSPPATSISGRNFKMKPVPD